VGAECFLGDECLLDLAEGITMQPQVTLAERVVVLTHTNVGYADHPLQASFPPSAAPVVFERGCFVGASVTILPGVTIGHEAFVAAGSVVTRDVAPRTLVAGVPARRIRDLA
jgi:acetyltransferase-like isoleucine patch superfamily enzyme